MDVMTRSKSKQKSSLSEKERKRRKREFILIFAILIVVALMTFVESRIINFGADIAVSNTVLMFILININLLLLVLIPLKGQIRGNIRSSVLFQKTKELRKSAALVPQFESKFASNTEIFI